jgi:hypothetical protein
MGISFTHSYAIPEIVLSEVLISFPYCAFGSPFHIMATTYGSGAALTGPCLETTCVTDSTGTAECGSSVQYVLFLSVNISCSLLTLDAADFARRDFLLSTILLIVPIKESNAISRQHILRRR